MINSNFLTLALGATGDGPEWNALQPEAGVFDERVFAALDWVIAEAGARGIRLSLPLVNYWPAYGGIPQYVRSAPISKVTHSQFAIIPLRQNYHCSFTKENGKLLPAKSSGVATGGAARDGVWRTRATQRPSMGTTAARTSSRTSWSPSLPGSTPSQTPPTGDLACPA